MTANQSRGCRGNKVNGKSTALTPKKSVDLALLAHGARYDQDDHAQGCSFCVGSGQAHVRQKSHTALPFGTHRPVERVRQATDTRTPMAGPDSPAQALAHAGQENTRARPVQGLTSDFRGMSEQVAKGW